MSEFKRGQEIEAVKPIRLANGITLEAGSRGVVIGIGSHDTVSVQFDDYIGGVSVWASLIAPTTHPAHATAPAAGEGDYQTLARQLERGTAEMRRYVEGNGFTWCEDEDTVFNVTTAIGWMGGALEAQATELGTLRAQLAATEARLQAAAGVVGDFDELLTNLSSKLDSTALSILRTYFAAEHSMRTRAQSELAETRQRLQRAESDTDALRFRLGEAVEAFTELLGVVAISKDVSQYDFNMARKALQQLIKSASK